MSNPGKNRYPKHPKNVPGTDLGSKIIKKSLKWSPNGPKINPNSTIFGPKINEKKKIDEKTAR